MLTQPAWQFTREDAARITQPVLNAAGADTPSYFREIYETIEGWLPQAENFIASQSSHAMLQLNPKGIADRLARFFADHPLDAR